MESKEYSWAWVTAARLLTELECELVCAYLLVSANNGSATIYNGTSTTGETVVTLSSAVVTGLPFNPPAPIYCRKGLYVGSFTTVTGILVMWRHL